MGELGPGLELSHTHAGRDAEKEWQEKEEAL